MTNRLAHATSPYLLQHAENPVHWWEWGSAAFAEARERNIPILLSVGYAACHWCHVMAHESFEDEATAAFMNEHFINIKVDREERPDVDAIYMAATTAMTGQGGWPMTVVMDHAGAPFFAGTYFPDQPRHGMPAFTQVLQGLSEAWHERGEDITRVTGKLREHLQSPNALKPDALSEDDLDAAVRALASEADRQRGGFGGAPKFPPSMVLEFLRRHHRRTGNEQARLMFDQACEAMARGGIYDQIGGGFARYAVDDSWVVPHFEKMLYDNAQLLGAYARRGDDLGRRVARETADFMLRELRTREGGFASALDADSEGVEGKFYAWTQQELVEVLGTDDGAWAARQFSVTPGGTFERGSSTLQRLSEPDDLERYADVSARLLAARAERVRPECDDKVVAAWNGLAIAGLVDTAIALDDDTYLDAAIEAAQLIERLHRPDGRLRRVSRDGVVGEPGGVLEDLGDVAVGYLALVQVTGDHRWLAAAGELIDDAIERFSDDAGGFFDTANDAEALIARPQDPSDNAHPSGTSAMIHALLTYAAITGEGRYRTRAEQALHSVGTLAKRAPRFAGWSLAAAEQMVGDSVEVAVVGPAGARRDALAAAGRELPGAVVVVADAPDDAIGFLAGRGPIDGEPAAYVCRNQVCARPVTQPVEVTL